MYIYTVQSYSNEKKNFLNHSRFFLCNFNSNLTSCFVYCCYEILCVSAVQRAVAAQQMESPQPCLERRDYAPGNVTSSMNSFYPQLSSCCALERVNLGHGSCHFSRLFWNGAVTDNNTNRGWTAFWVWVWGRASIAYKGSTITNVYGLCMPCYNYNKPVAYLYRERCDNHVNWTIYM